MAENQRVQVGYVQANLRDVTVPMGLTVDSIKITAEGLDVQTHPMEAKVSQPGNLEVFVGEKSLANFLNKKSPGGLRNFVVHAKEGKLHIQASMVMLLEIRATAICTLRIVDGQQLHVDLESVQIMGTGATNLVQSQIEKMNPVLDVGEFPVRASLDTVQVADGGIILLGKVAPP